MLFRSKFQVRGEPAKLVRFFAGSIISLSEMGSGFHGGYKLFDFFVAEAVIWGPRGSVEQLGDRGSGILREVSRKTHARGRKRR